MSELDKLIEQIEKIREINKQHKLVIFVGAGVSRNSGVCSWWELVKEMASEINYNDICEKCETKASVCSEGEDLGLCSDKYKCQHKYNFSSEEFLKIPQFFYEDRGEDEYINFLKRKFCREYTSNEIDELIIDLEPEHIITTNYDHLIEDVSNLSIGNYTIIKNDKDLLEKYGLRYIIKMHGDIDDIKHIVLKEDDYLNYSKNHELIEMCIKNLLINKTFLFIGYSLSDNNLKLIMSYINYFAKDLSIKRSPHYLVTNEVTNKNRNNRYWANKGVELVNLSTVSEFMIERTPCNLNEYGKPLYTFLKYIKDDKLAYSGDAIVEFKNFLLKNLMPLEPFHYISYTTFLSSKDFSIEAEVEVQDGSLNITIRDEENYNKLCLILSGEDEDSLKIIEGLNKARIYAIKYDKLTYPFVNHNKNKDELFELSLKWEFEKIINKLSQITDNTLEKAYYYSLIYKTKDDKCFDMLKEIKSALYKKDFKQLSLNDLYEISVLEYNFITIRILREIVKDYEQIDKFDKLMKLSSARSKAFDYMAKVCRNNNEMLYELNISLLKHEEYYIHKPNSTAFAETSYGDLFKLQAIVYDYYYFYKKNFLMLDWFINVSRMCEPYIKAILCTYYPNEFQHTSKLPIGGTPVKPYPLNLTDINIIIRHIKFNKFNSLISYYKVSNLTLEPDVDITEIFDNFCTSVRSYWVREYIEYISVFGKLLSLVELTKEESSKVLKSFLKLVTPKEPTDIQILRYSLKALWLFIEKHYDETGELYYKLLNLLINDTLVKSLSYEDNDYLMNIINKLSLYADKVMYDECCNLIHKVEKKTCIATRKKACFPYTFKDILFKFDKSTWKNCIINNLDHNWNDEVYYYLMHDIISYDANVAKYFKKKVKEPKEQSEVINSLVLLIIYEKISDLSKVSFLKKYSKKFDYLDFLFKPKKFDYSKITTTDYIWCCFINSDKYRSIILPHKTDFWSKKDEERINSGLGGNLENRIAYKYLFD